MEYRLTSTLLLATIPLLGACDAGSDPSPGDGTEGSSGAVESTAGPGETATVPEGTTGSASTTGGQSGSTDAESSSSTGEDPSTTGSGGESDTDGKVLPEDLPYGGFVQWTVQNSSLNAQALLYTYEPPTNPDSTWEPQGPLLPVGPPRTEDEMIAPEPPAKAPKDDSLVPTFTNYDVGSEIYVQGPGNDATLELDPESGNFWFNSSTAPDLSGGPWSVELLGGTEGPAAEFIDVIEGIPHAASGFALSANAQGLPGAATWTPQADALSAEVNVILMGGGAFLQSCSLRLVDDGEAEFPSFCTDIIFEPEGAALDTMLVLQSHVFAVDVEYGGRRIQLGHRVTEESFFGTGNGQSADNSGSWNELGLAELSEENQAMLESMRAAGTGHDDLQHIQHAAH
ncbi:MAG: hypothetical protein KUG77_07305 [Nannocystaceae bacterium]|nr:hypothetical protein [Nannocystaceae bacterium]